MRVVQVARPGRVCWLKVFEEFSATVVQGGEAVLVQGSDQLLAGAEVVLHRRVVALAGGGADLAQGDVFDAAFGEQALGGAQDQRAGGIATALGPARRLLLDIHTGTVRHSVSGK
jgi:hypothetical protein